MIKSILKSDCIIFKENIEMSYNIIIKKMLSVYNINGEKWYVLE